MPVTAPNLDVFVEALNSKGIIMLNEGRLEQVGTPEELYRRPRTAFVASFLGKINWMRGEVLSGASTNTVAIAGRPVPCGEGNGFVGGRVRVGVRPEDLRIDPNGCLAARVVGRRFLGDSIVVRLVLADGTSLMADQRSPLADAAVGHEVHIAWDPEAAHLFPADANEADDEASV